MSAARTPEEIQSSIEETREEMGDTVAALSAKTDVKAQVRHKLDDASETVRRNPVPVIVAAGLGVGFLLVRMIRR